MGHNDHIDFELYEAIQDLIDEDLLEVDSKGYGIAQKIIHEGRGSLSPKQLYVYEREVESLLTSRAEEIEMIQRINSWPV